MRGSEKQIEVEGNQRIEPKKWLKNIAQYVTVIVEESNSVTSGR